MNHPQSLSGALKTCLVAPGVPSLWAGHRKWGPLARCPQTAEETCLSLLGARCCPLSSRSGVLDCSHLLEARCSIMPSRPFLAVSHSTWPSHEKEQRQHQTPPPTWASTISVPCHRSRCPLGPCWQPCYRHAKEAVSTARQSLMQNSGRRRWGRGSRGRTGTV